MKLWLASYPRSGNTFLRIILKQAFGLSSASIYKGENEIFDRFQNVAQIVGHDEERSGDAAGADDGSSDWFPVKTHDFPPTDGAPSIYIVRDGKNALISYYHYMKRFSQAEVTLDAIVRGDLWPGSWSDHFRAWAPQERPHTLFLRYEELRDENEEACRRISKFLGVEPLAGFEVSFSRLQALNPDFFRSSSDAYSTEMDELKCAFERKHGELMAELGYA